MTKAQYGNYEMKSKDKIKLSYSGLARNRRRTLLTVAGIVIGVSALNIMISIGHAMNLATDRLLMDWGDLTRIEVYGQYTTKENVVLSNTVIEQIKALPGVVAVTPQSNFNAIYGDITAGKNHRYLSSGISNIVGIDKDAVSYMDYDLLSGTYLTSDSYYGPNNIPVMVFDLAVFNFHDTTQSVNSPVRIRSPYDRDGNITVWNPFFDISTETLTLRLANGYDANGNPLYRDYNLVVVGVLKSRADGGSESRTFVMGLADMARLETMNNTESGNPHLRQNEYSTVLVKVGDVAYVETVEKTISDMGFQTNSMSQVRSEMQGQIAQSQTMLGSLAAISLVIAALNISNTMTMLISERTREIAIMKVFGCSTENIRGMLLIESTIFGFVGGIIAAVISICAGYFLNNIVYLSEFFDIEFEMNFLSMFGFGANSTDSPISVFPVWLLPVTIGLSCLLGFLSGWPPTKRVITLKPVIALNF